MVAKSNIHGSGIYQITFLPSGDSYVGQARSITGRWGSHCSSLGHDRALPKIAALIMKGTVDEVRFKVVHRCEAAELDYWETYYALKLQPTLNSAGFGSAMLAKVRTDYPELANSPAPETLRIIDPETDKLISAARDAAAEQRKRDDEARAASTDHGYNRWLVAFLRNQTRLGYAEWQAEQQKVVSV